jgi:hypothetical protein
MSVTRKSNGLFFSMLPAIRTSVPYSPSLVEEEKGNRYEQYAQES